jgi:hypothetical protein
MLDPVLRKLQFEGKTMEFGYFDPPPQKFFVPRDAVFAAVRVTILAQTEKDVHLTSVEIYNGSTRVASFSMKVPDREPTICAVFGEFSRLSPDVEYELKVSSGGFGPPSAEVNSMGKTHLDLRASTAATCNETWRLCALSGSLR